MKLIPLSQQGKNKGKYFAKVDDDDYEYLMQWRWRVEIRHYKNYSISYAVRTIRRKGVDGKIFWTSIKMHTAIHGQGSIGLIDHANNDGLDNQKANLIKCTFAINLLNRRNWGKSKYRGVCYHKNKNCYVVSLRVNYKLKHIGYFHNEDDAAKAYNDAAIKYRPEYARLNIIDLPK